MRRVRGRPMWCAAASLAVALCGSHSGAEADARLALVVAKVGATTITVEDVERRLRSIPDFQLATFGDGAAEIASRFLDQVMIRDALLAEGAKARKLEDLPGVRERITQVLRDARAEAVRRDVVVSPEEVLAFFAENHARFESPERIGVFRILCATREQADAVLGEAKVASGGLTRWNALARERSIDKATQYRGGDLGFLAADGSSDQVSVRVDPRLFAAAKSVRDGELVPEPVPEGAGFAVVWRRASMPAVRRSVEEVTGAIRQVLERRKAEDALAALLKELRRTRGVQAYREIVDTLEIDAFGEVGPAKRAKASAPHAGAPVTPSATPRGLR